MLRIFLNLIATQSCVLCRTGIREMIEPNGAHETAPTYYEPDLVGTDDDQHKLRVLIDEIATMRGLTIQMSLRMMSMASAPDEDSAVAVRDEFNSMVEQFHRNMGLLYGDTPFGDEPRERLNWIRNIAARTPEREEKMMEVQASLDATREKLNGGFRPDFYQARQFFVSLWPTVRDEMTGMIWDLWADLDMQKSDALKAVEQLHVTLETTLAEIKKISMAVRMTSLNASVQAARAGDAGRGFGFIAAEVKKLAENIQSAADRAEAMVSEMRSN